MSEGPDDELLFTYGTLQFAEVQLDTFGRIVAGEGDTLPCYTIDYTEITDQRVVDVSGLSVHPVIRHTGNPLDKVVGPAVAIAAPFSRAQILHRPATFAPVPAPTEPAPAQAVIKPDDVTC